MVQKSLEERVKELEDVREINEVFRKWNYACTGGFNGVQAGRFEALECLTDDATIEIQEIHDPGKGPKGRQECYDYWAYWYGDNGPLPYVFQTSFDEKVEVNGDTAVQYCNFLFIGQLRDDAPSVGVCRRVNYLVRTPQGWKINKTTGDAVFRSPLPGLQGSHMNKLSAQEARTPVHQRPWKLEPKPTPPWPHHRTDTGR